MIATIPPYFQFCRPQTPCRLLVASLLICSLAPHFGAGPAHAATYYLSPSGNDAAAGTSPSTPWRTTAKVRAHAWSPGFRPGDQILFQGGATFHTTPSDALYFQTDRSRGTRSKPIRIGSYGTGRATISSRGEHGIMIWAPVGATNDLGYIIQDLNFTGDGAARQAGGTAYGIMVWNASNGSPALLQILRCDFTNFSGGGLITGRDTGRGLLRDLVIRGCRAHHNAGLPGLPFPSGSGIVVSGADNVLIEHCIAHNNGANNTAAAGPVGIWAYDANRVIIQRCVSYRNQSAGRDGGGFDLDGGTTNSVIQYCYSHDNDGAGFLLAQYEGAGTFGNNTIRFNISQNDGRRNSYGGISVWGFSSSFRVTDSFIYHNTVFVNDRNLIQGNPAAIRFKGSHFNQLRFHNNLLITDGSGARLVSADTALTTSTAFLLGNGY